MGTKGEIEKALARLRQVEEECTRGVEGEIRGIYKRLLRELKEYLGVAYADYGQGDMLSYAILQEKRQYRAFLQEVEGKINGLTPQASIVIEEMVSGAYERAYRGMAEAVVGSAGGGEALEHIFDENGMLRPQLLKEAVETPVGGLTLKDTLEKNGRETVYRIKQEIGIGLMKGEGIGAMAHRISQCVDGEYRKAIRVVRTEGHRIREAGFIEAATELSEGVARGGGKKALYKTWRTMKDERVRPNAVRKSGNKWIRSTSKGGGNHVKMEGVRLPVEEAFDLGGGIRAMAPGLSGDGGNDIGCRCYLSYEVGERVGLGAGEAAAADGGDEEIGAQKAIVYKEDYATHMVYGTVGKRDKGVVGGHNLEEFKKVFADNGYNLEACILGQVEHPDFPGIYSIEYRMPALGYNKGVLEPKPGVYKSIDHPKTVYDPNIYSDEQMLAWGREAMEDAMAGNPPGREFTGHAKNGLAFRGYLDDKTGEIRNFHPIIETKS